MRLDYVLAGILEMPMITSATPLGELKIVRGLREMNCPDCHGEDCIHIEIRLTDAETVQFYSCRKCESKWWENSGGPIALDQVLGIAARR